MWHIVQFRSPEKLQKQHIVGKLQPFPPCASELNETYGTRKRTHRATIIKNFLLTGFKILKLHQVEGQSTKQSSN